MSTHLSPGSKQAQVGAPDGTPPQTWPRAMRGSGTGGSAARGKVADPSPALCSRSDTHSGLLQAFFSVLGSQRHLLAARHVLCPLTPLARSDPPGPPTPTAPRVPPLSVAERPP